MPQVNPSTSAPKIVSNPLRLSWRNVILGLFIGATLIGGGLVAFYYFELKSVSSSDQNQQMFMGKPKETSPSATPAQPRIITDETAGWKTYTGETNDIKFSLKYPPTFFVTGFAWTSSPSPDPEAAGFDNVKGQQPGSTHPFEDGEIRLAIKNYSQEEFKKFNGNVGIQRAIEKPTVSTTFDGLKALKYIGRDPNFGGSNLPSDLGRVMYYVNNQTPIAAQHHFVFECLFNSYSNA